MPLDPQPPPLPNKAPRATIQNLHKAIYDIKLPKSTSAKSCSVPLEDWNTIRSLAASLVQQPGNSANSDSARISSLSTKLDSLASKLDTLASQIPQTTPTPGSKRRAISGSRNLICPRDCTPLAWQHFLQILRFCRATSAPSHVPHDTTCDILLTPRDRQNKAFSTETHFAIQQQFNALMVRLGLKYTPAWAEGQEVDAVPSARAVAKYRNSDIRLTVQSSAEVDYLRRHTDSWLPAFSSQLELRSPTFAVVMHRVPTDFEIGTTVYDFDTDRWENDVNELADANAGHLEADYLARVHWIGRKSSDQVRKLKKHSSLVLHFTSARAANQCIVNKLALHGHLHHTEKYRPQPLQCFHCYRFGHIASQCKHS
ncbi:hypothetical protein B0H10DRAFT_1651915, partial [Mycena sp. CBHHK59/15]